VIRLAVRVCREQAEAVLAELLDLAPAGVEEADVGADVVEYAVYGSPGELPQLPQLRAVAGDALVEIATSELPDDWSERWRRFHRPVLIEPPPSGCRQGAAGRLRVGRARDLRAGVPGLYVRPPWEPRSGRADVEEIVIDPGQAFGTGAHATTRLCLELLLARTVHAAHRGPLLDVGTGSGVLAIAAARLGYAPVRALDNDPESVAAAVANARANGVAIDISRFDLRHEPMPTMPALDGARAPVVLVANLLRPLLLDLAHSLERPPADLIVGGLLAEDVASVVRAFEERLQLREHERRTSGEWAAAWLARPADR
jgi:ribosomal protein L11 methyltransferase